MTTCAPRKILCIAFKYLGDVVVAIPAMQALRAHWSDAELHVIVAEDAAPLLEPLPWINHVWALPRTRGRARLRDSWPIIRALRHERFDLSIDFMGNDRGAVLSLLSGARRRFGTTPPRGFLGRKLCYHHAIEEAPFDWHEIDRHLHALRVFGIAPQPAPNLELRASPDCAAEAARLLPESAIIGHITTSKPLKEWPLDHWLSLAQRARASGYAFLFAAGPSARERALLAELGRRAPEIPHLPEIARLDLYLAVLARARALVSGDTGPMHFAAGLGTPTLSLFGPSRPDLWAPRAPHARLLVAPDCRCAPTLETCAQPESCFNRLSPDRVWLELQSLLAAARAPHLG